MFRVRFSCKCIVLVYRNRCLRNRETQCQYSCGNGFYIDDVNDTKTCGLNGVLPSAPPCAEYQCPLINNTASEEFAGAVCYQEGASGTPTCEFHCQEGWEIVGVLLCRVTFLSMGNISYVSKKLAHHIRSKMVWK